MLYWRLIWGALAVGTEGITVDSLESVGPALKKAVDMSMNQGKICVIGVMRARELGDPFRRGALAKNGSNVGDIQACTIVLSIERGG